MIVRVKNIQYFDWEVPDELIPLYDFNNKESIQQLIDEHFDPEHISVALASDEYYEFEEVL